MTEFDPCLAQCDKALAEADILLSALADCPESHEPQLAAARARIESLRREVDRLRGLTIAPIRRELSADSRDFDAPWPVQPRDSDPIGGQTISR